MKQKKAYSELTLNVVQLSGKSELLSGSSPVSGSSGAPGLRLGGYGSGTAQFE